MSIDHSRSEYVYVCLYDSPHAPSQTQGGKKVVKESQNE